MDRGRPRNLQSPEQLMDLWNEYKAHVHSTPDSEEVITVKGDVVTRTMQRPLTRQGFIAFVFRNHGISIKDYVDNKYDNYSEVVTCIRHEWEEDQYSGTITGKYKAQTLVARMNGLSDKQEVKTDGNFIITMDLNNGKNE